MNKCIFFRIINVLFITTYCRLRYNCKMSSNTYFTCYRDSLNLHLKDFESNESKGINPECNDLAQTLEDGVVAERNKLDQTTVGSHKGKENIHAQFLTNQ